MQNEMRCPRCHRGDALVLIETHEEHGHTDAGRIRIDGNRLVANGPFHFEPGDPIRVLIQCDGCGHEWRPRRQSCDVEISGRS